MEKQYSEAAIKLFEAVTHLNTVEECAAFFEDICTIKEIQDLSQRLQVAAMLNQGEKYQTIEQSTGASTATISRVNKCLLYGSGGYRTVLERCSETEGKEQK